MRPHMLPHVHPTLTRLAAALTCVVLALYPLLPAQAGDTTKGQVLEVRDVDAYTYLRLKTDKGETWAAVEKAPVKVGAQVTLYQSMVMRNFESKALKKTFDQIVFGSLTDPGQPAPATQAGASPHGKAPGTAAAAPAAPVAKLAKAPGADGRTVAEVVGGAAALKNKPVSLRVQVVKANLGIMGKNWYHVQDGSGQPGGNDLLVTSKDVAAVGDVRLVKGTVRTDVSLGGGYDFAVIVEDASLAK